MNEVDDIVPGLLDEIHKKFKSKTSQSEKLKILLALLKNKKATYLDANDFAIELGQILASTFEDVLKPSVMPEGKMHYNIANRVLNDTLKNNYKLITKFTTSVQGELNRQANLGLKAQVPKLNQNRIDGFVNKISTAKQYEDIKWMLGDQIVNFSQHVVDEAIDTNCHFQSEIGLRPKITRRLMGRACKWCKNLAGTYEYSEKPDEIFQRHENCRCTVEYDPGSGRRQNVWSKKWRDVRNNDKIEARKKINLKPKVGIEIDKFTPCLRDTRTGKLIDTAYKPVTIFEAKAISLKNRGWNFDWSNTTGQVYQLTLKGSNVIQGLVSFSAEQGYNWLDLVESAPTNRGNTKRYDGVGPHLFAIAARDSMERGNEGFVSFTPKTNLREYYQKKLGAISLSNGNMFLDTDAAKILINRYFGKE